MGRPGNPHIQMNTISSFRICSFNLQGFSKNDPKLQMVKLLTAIKFHDIIAQWAKSRGQVFIIRVLYIQLDVEGFSCVS